MIDPFDLAEKLLALVVSGFSDAEVELPAENYVQYIAPGQTVAYDGPQLTVNVPRIYHGQPGAEASTFNPRQPAPVCCDLQVVILRTTPVQQEDGSPPDSSDLTKSAKENIADIVTMRQVVYNIVARYLLVDRGPQVTISPVLAIGPQGGLVGAAVTISLELV